MRNVELVAYSLDAVIFIHDMRYWECGFYCDCMPLVAEQGGAAEAGCALGADLRDFLGGHVSSHNTGRLIIKPPFKTNPKIAIELRKNP